MQYLKTKLSQHGTWAGISAIVMGCAGAAPPFSYIAIACGVAGILAPF